MAIQRWSIWCAGPFRLSHSSNQINQKNQTDEMNQRDKMHQLPATRREMLDCKAEVIPRGALS
jgi:hypothetical protein